MQQLENKLFNAVKKYTLTDEDKFEPFTLDRLKTLLRDHYVSIGDEKLRYVVFDLEATTWNDGRKYTKEVIEFGAVFLDGKLNEVDTFSCCIKPKIDPMLSDFCKELTGITQSEVDNAWDFKTEIVENLPYFIKWNYNIDPLDLVFCGWGKDDLLLREEYARLNIPYNLGPYINLAELYKQKMQTKHAALKDVMQRHNHILTWRGPHHRALSDAMAAADIFKNFLK